MGVAFSISIPDDIAEKVKKLTGKDKIQDAVREALKKFVQGEIQAPDVVDVESIKKALEDYMKMLGEIAEARGQIVALVEELKQAKERTVGVLPAEIYNIIASLKDEINNIRSEIEEIKRMIENIRTIIEEKITSIKDTNNPGNPSADNEDTEEKNFFEAVHILSNTLEVAKYITSEQIEAICEEYGVPVEKVLEELNKIYELEYIEEENKYILKGKKQ